MKKLAYGIFGGMISFVSLVGYAMYKKNKSKVHIYLDFGEKDRDAEKMFVDIWRKNKEYFSRMTISNDDRFSYGGRNVRRYRFDIDDQGLHLLDGFIINF